MKYPITETAVKDYKPSVIGAPLWFGYDEYPRLTALDIEMMLLDDQVQFGLGILYGPLAIAEWSVKCKSQEVTKFIDNQLKRIWKRDLYKIVNFFAFGSAGGEVLYDDSDEHYQCDGLADFHIHDMRPLKRKGEWCGVSVQNTNDPHTRKKPFLMSPKAWWIAPDARYGELYGRSRLYPVWHVWQEKRGPKGATKSRRQWFMRHGFHGGKIYHPHGNVIDDETGEIISNQDISREILEKIETGGVMVLPNVRDANGNRLWEHEDAKLNLQGSEQLLEYPKDLNEEILRAMGIPPEVVQAGDTGSGYAGRAIPAVMFYTQMDRIVDNVIQALKAQILDWLVHINFNDEPYEIEPKSLVPKPPEEQQQGGVGGMFGGVPGQDQPQMGGEEEEGGQPPIEDLLGGMVGEDQVQMSHSDIWLAQRYSEWKGQGPPPQDSGYEAYQLKRGPRAGQTIYRKPVGSGRGKGDQPEHTVDSLQQHVRELMSGEQEITENHVKGFAKQLMTMTVKDIQALKKSLGLKASGKKKELANKIAERALKMTGGQKPEQPPEQTPEQADQEFQQAQRQADESWKQYQADADFGLLDEDPTQQAVEHLKSLPSEQLQDVLKDFGVGDIFADNDELPRDEQGNVIPVEERGKAEQKPAEKMTPANVPEPENDQEEKPTTQQQATPKPTATVPELEKAQDQPKPKTEAKPLANVPAKNKLTPADVGEPKPVKTATKPLSNQPKKPPAPKPASKPAKESPKLQKSVRDNYDRLTHYIEYEDGPVVIPHLYQEMKEQDPNLTVEDFHREIQNLVDAGELQYHVLNEVRELPEDQKPLVPFKNDRYYYWVNRGRNWDKKPESPQQSTLVDTLTKLKETIDNSAKDAPNEVYDNARAKVQELIGKMPVKDAINTAKEFGVQAKSRSEAVKKITEKVLERKIIRDRISH